MTCVQTTRLERMNRFGIARWFHSSSSRKLAFARSAAHQQNMEVLRNRRGMQPHRYGNSSRSGAGAAGARLDWLCGRRALHSQRLLVLQQKMLDTGVFCLVYLGLLNRRTSRTQSPKSQKRISGTQPATVANTLPTVQCASRSVIQHNCFSLKIATTVRFVRMR